MAMDLFSVLLEEITTQLQLPSPLYVDNNNSCLITLTNGVAMQLEPYAKGDKLILGCPLGEVMPGRYRLDLFKTALISNSQPPPNIGVFAFSSKSNSLLLFVMLDNKNLTGSQVAEVIAPLAEKAFMWKEAISQGQIPALFMSGGGGFGALFNKGQL